MCFLETEGYDASKEPSEQEDVLCSNFHRIAECMAAQQVTAQEMGCTDSDYNDKAQSDADKDFFFQLAAREECTAVGEHSQPENKLSQRASDGAIIHSVLRRAPRGWRPVHERPTVPTE
jgi:hypothetical protein